MLRIGVGGYPIAFGKSVFRKDRLHLFEWLRSLGLDAFEAMMTYGPRTPIPKCLAMKDLAIKFDIKLSVHAAYYIVPTSSDRDKAHRSIEMLKRTFELADLMGADAVILHPGSLYGRESGEVAQTLMDNLAAFFQQVGKSSVGLFLETAGKRAQFGSVEEILSVTNEVDGAFPCIDFGHVHARTGGGLASRRAIDGVFSTLRKSGAFDEGARVHFHYTPIHYGAKGEIQHRKIDDAYSRDEAAVSTSGEEAGALFGPRYDHIIECLVREKAVATMISETHNSQEQGAMAMRDCYRHLLGLPPIPRV